MRLGCGLRKHQMPATRCRRIDGAPIWRVLVRIRRKLEPSGYGGQDDYRRLVVNVG